MDMDMDYEDSQDLPNHPCNPEMILSAWMYWVQCEEGEGRDDKSQSRPTTRQSARLIVSLPRFHFSSRAIAM